MYRLWPVSQYIINIKCSEVINAMIKEYNEIWIVLAPLLRICDRVYCDAADDPDWICNTLQILNKPFGKRLARC